MGERKVGGDDQVEGGEEGVREGGRVGGVALHFGQGVHFLDAREAGLGALGWEGRREGGKEGGEEAVREGGRGGGVALYSGQGVHFLISWTPGSQASARWGGREVRNI